MTLNDTPRDIPIVRTIAELRQIVADWRREGLKIGFVPTMGALHQGHLSLVQTAAKHADKVVVSIFVNPTQFAPHEDFDAYPRTEASDAKALTGTPASLIYAPKPREMYADNHSTQITVEGISEGLCATTRPHFFGGVALVVAKLLLQCLPDVAVFGEKDYQQLLVIKRMVRDLNIPVDILSGPTQRDADGLATSSRNAYLTSDERKVAPLLHATLQDTAARLRAGEPVEGVLVSAIQKLKDAGFDPVDYLELRSAEDLTRLHSFQAPARLLVAARLGKTRLIDNIEV
ncbi:MAG: pantoate--beta-alanine ligase [Alphaproteobacteria bacterium]|nr:MAG: pantoate--beta-alanine ligase [Alphaproteobacteria bacterium]